jgi:hypothetical protein
LTLATNGDFGSLILTGKVDSGWIDGVLDRAVAAKRRAFDAAWQDPIELSAWTVTIADPSEELSVSQLMSALSFQLPVKPEQQELFDLLDKGALDSRAGSLELLSALELLPDTLLADDLREYFKFRAALGLERWSDALEHLSKLQSALEQQPSRDLMRAILLINADKLEEGAAILETLAQADPKLAVVHLMLVQTLLRSARTPQAREAIRRAREALPASAGLLELELKVTKADLGPPWKRVFEHTGAYFTVRSDVSVKLCRDAVRVLDKAMERCLFEFGPLPNGKPERSLAYLFTGKSGYRDYVHGIADSSMENSRGIYATQLKQIVAWNQPDIEELWSTLRHECVHRYLDLRIGYAPRWFNEGLAETFAAGAQRDQSWKPGTPREMWLGLLREKRPAAPSFQDFAYMDEATFLQQCETNYAYAWAWMHYLRFENDIGRKLFNALLRGFDEGLDTSVVIDRALQGVDTAALQRDFLTQINALLR